MKRSADCFNQGLDFYVPVFSTFKSSLYCYIHRGGSYIAEGTKARDIMFPDELLSINGGSIFLLFDADSRNRTSAFTSQKGRKDLINCEAFFMDGVKRCGDVIIRLEVRTPNKTVQ